MNTLHLHWTIGTGKSATAGNMINANLDDTCRVLQKVLCASGSAELSVENGPETGPHSLHLFHEGGRSVVMLGEDAGEKYAVRSYKQPSKNDEACATATMEKILGNYWISRSICTDTNIVFAIFHEFIETGDVSTKLLN